jgi:hypothetical protein
LPSAAVRAPRLSARCSARHGITLAFGFTLIGVAQDYPIHLFSHQQRRRCADSARTLWPTLATGVASTCVAYLAFLFSGVRGLAQPSAFAVVGLAIATTTHPVAATDGGGRDPGDSRCSDASGGHRQLARPLWLGIAIAATASATCLVAATAAGQSRAYAMLARAARCDRSAPRSARRTSATCW